MKKILLSAVAALSILICPAQNGDARTGYTGSSIALMAITPTVFTQSAMQTEKSIPFSSVNYESSEDGTSARVTLTAGTNTKLYSVQFVEGEKSIRAKSISNSSGEMHFPSGATMRAGSSLLLEYFNFPFLLDAGTVVTCQGDKESAFVPRKIRITTEPGGEAYTYDIATGKWE